MRTRDPGDRVDEAAAARRLIRTCGHAALATNLDGHPYVSLVATACDLDATPLLLLSDLAQHTRNLRADPRVSLLFEDTAGYADPLAGPRLSLLGRAERCDDEHARTAAAARFAARHPSSAAYAGYADFRLYRVVAERGHLVAGFARITWIDASGLRLSVDASRLAAAESEILEHMNRDHAATLQLCAERLLQRGGAGWVMTGVDPEGADLWRPAETGARTARLDFPESVLTPAAARCALAGLAARAREAAPAG